MFPFSIKELITIVPIFLISLTIHEAAHSFAALALGDKTSQNMGRFSLNPLNHIDPFGFILFIVAGFGWAKPVMINRNNLKNPLRDDVLIALAGPLSNFIMACISGLILRVIFTLNPEATFLMNLLVQTLFNVVVINVSLGVFNLLPIPPLDGSHIVTNLLERYNPQLAYKFYKMGSSLIIILIMLERVTNIDFLPIGAAVNFGIDLVSKFVIGI